MPNTNSLKVDTSVWGILALTIPISLSKLVPELNYLFNSIFLGHIGSLELALAGITGVYYLIFSAIGYGLNNALLSIMSRRAGENKRDEIFSTLWHGLFIGFILAILAIGFTYFFIEDLLNWSGIAPESTKIATEYLKIRMWGLLFLYGLQMQNAYLISLQKSKYLLFAAFGATVINIFLDYAMIFGHYGFPALGFNGAAYASVISEIMGMFIVFLVIKWSKISLVFNIHYQWQLRWNTLKLVFRQALPLMGQYAISTMAWWIFFILVNRNYNIPEQAASQAMRNIFGLSGVFTWAFGSATNTIISNLIGQGKVSEMFKIINRIIFISLSGIIIFIFLLNIFSSGFLSLFGQNADFIVYSVGPLRVISIAMIILGVGVIWLNAVVATGKTVIVFWIEFLGIVSYLTYVFFVIEHLKLSHSVAWMSEWIYWGVMMIASVLYLKYGNWRKNLTY